MDQINNQQLQNFLKLFSDNPYYQAAIVVLLGLVASRIINAIFTRIILRIANQTHSRLDNHIILITRPALFYSVQLIALAIANNIVFSNQAEIVIYSLLKSVAVFVWTVFAIRLARLILRTFSATPNYLPVVSVQTLPLFENLAILVIASTAIYFLFSAWNIDMTAWLASAGIVGIAVGFAAKDTLANLFAGVFILADAPYKIGDYVVLDTGERGEVTHIGIRSTRLLTRDDVEVTVPNSIMGNTKIINESGGPHKKYRIRLKVGVAYGSDIDQVKQVLMNVAENESGICADPEPRVRFRNFGNSGLDFELLGWVEEPMLRGRILDALNSDVYKRFQQENIEIPYSKQDLYIKSLPEPK
ncbi:MAG: mechanosensitive ion channel family protein [Gammaproteobacteria bacterium]|nr:mechanosensitive ion channel family protein [Gammaproteobacteria bacterium]